MKLLPTSHGEEADTAIRRLQWLWLGMLFLPLAYLIACVLLGKWLFNDPEGPRGFLSLSPGGMKTLIALGVIAVALGEALLLYFRRRSDHLLDEAAEDIERFGALLQRRLLFLGAVCDTVSFLGLIGFLLTGDLRAMFALGAASYFLYIQAYPRDELAGKA
jgi:hypothetical protein